MNRIFGLLAAYYLIGVIAIAVINRRKKDADAKARWTKLGMYLVITLSLTSALCFAPWIAVGFAILIVAVGWFELSWLPGYNGAAVIALMAAYSGIVLLFLWFIGDAFRSKTACHVYLVVLSFDGFSQIAGQLIGGPRIAPGDKSRKTYSGLAGGLIMGVATSAFLLTSFNLKNMLDTLVICLLAFTGDMIASAVKRRAGVKDYSALIPGHGGVLDRFDSFLFAGAMLQCYFRLS